jgi:hypothetical protein
MRKSGRTWLLASVIIAFAVGCGGGGSPAGPSATTQVAGLWTFAETYASATGGECFAANFQTLVGQTGTGTVQMSQSGASLTARATDDVTGGSCDYTGTAGANTLALNVVSCTASDVLGATCPNGARRDLKLLTGGYNATLTSNTRATGTGAQTYNIFVAGTSTPVGTVSVTTQLTATRR